MLSEGKHLSAHRNRPFAAAQGDTEGKHEHGSTVILELSSSFEPCRRGLICDGHTSFEIAGHEGQWIADSEKNERA